MHKLHFKILFFILVSLLAIRFAPVAQANISHSAWWEVQSVDTMKYSRDLAREKLNDKSFDDTIDFQVKTIAELGATHVAIGTPYDEEFVPYLKRWVLAARKYSLKVWFRGNFAGWEDWFEYVSIDKNAHISLLEEFITDNPELFENGDIFTSCPECENGAIGDPRNTGKTSEFRNFLIDEYELSRKLFEDMGKDVKSNYFSMNGDVAMLIMDKETTRKLDGIMVVDHYVNTPEELANDVRAYAESSGGKVVLGEMGVPIPDIHGNMSEQQKAEWLYTALSLLAKDESVVGLNYWVLSGGSTSLLTDSGAKKQIADVLPLFYKPKKFVVKVSNELGQAVAGSSVQVGPRSFISDSSGNVEVAIAPGIEQITIYSDGYKPSTQSVTHVVDPRRVVLQHERESLLFRIITFLRILFGK